MNIRQVIMARDGLTWDEASEAIREAKVRVFTGDDPEEVLLEEFGLEPDYIFDLID